MSYENEARLRKSISISISIKKMNRNTKDILEVLVNNIEENIDINIEQNEKLE